jgi:hypothetical protein
MSTVITLDTDAPRDAQYLLEVGEAYAECVRVMNHLTLSDEALEFPANADRLVRYLATAASRPPQLLQQVTGWLAAEHAAGRIRIVEGDYEGQPALAVTAAQVYLEDASGAAGMLQQALDTASRVTCDMAAAGTGDEEGETGEVNG